MDKQLFDNLNKQMNDEYHAAYLYNALSAGCGELNRHGAESWLRIHADEEVEHAERIRDFLQDKGYTVEFTGIEAVDKNVTSMLDTFQRALEHENIITGQIKDLYAEAVEKQDFEVQVFLNWFIEEQVEEEALFGEIVEVLEDIGDNKAAQAAYDRFLAQRQG